MLSDGDDNDDNRKMATMIVTMMLIMISIMVIITDYTNRPTKVGVGEYTQDGATPCKLRYGKWPFGSSYLYIFTNR